MLADVGAAPPNRDRPPRRVGLTVAEVMLLTRCREEEAVLPRAEREDPAARPATAPGAVVLADNDGADDDGTA